MYVYTQVFMCGYDLFEHLGSAWAVEAATNSPPEKPIDKS